MDLLCTLKKERILVYALYQNICFGRTRLHSFFLSVPSYPFPCCTCLQAFELFGTRTILQLVGFSCASIGSTTVHFQISQSLQFVGRFQVLCRESSGRTRSPYELDFEFWSGCSPEKLMNEKDVLF